MLRSVSLRSPALAEVTAVAVPGTRRSRCNCPWEQSVGCPSTGGPSSRTLTRHRMPHPWQFHGWAAANSPWHVHRSQLNRSVLVISFSCRPTCAATAAPDTPTRLAALKQTFAHPLLSKLRAQTGARAYALSSAPVWGTRPSLVNETRSAELRIRKIS